MFAAAPVPHKHAVDAIDSNVLTQKVLQERQGWTSSVGHAAIWENSNSRQAVTLLVGGPGSGKGTLGLQIARQLGCDGCITMSDALRQQQQQQVSCGRPDALDSSARLVGDAQACSAFDEILSAFTHRSVMVDGFPRSKEQVRPRNQSFCPIVSALSSWPRLVSASLHCVSLLPLRYTTP